MVVMPNFSVPLKYVASHVPTKSNVKEVFLQLKDKLAEKGFYEAGSAYADRYAEAGDKSSQTLWVFNRAINPDGKLNGKSSYNVCVLLQDNMLRAFMSNPDESREAASFDFDSYVSIFTYKIGLGGNFAAKVARKAEELSAKKAGNAYRIFLHNHLADMGGVELNNGEGGGLMKDDGISGDSALLLCAILHNADYVAVTSHNHFIIEPWKKFAIEAEKYGICLVPGIEATLTIHEYDPWLAGTREGSQPTPNGPHTLLLFDSPELADEFWHGHFSERPYDYAPNASKGVGIDKVYSDIERNYPGRIAILAAHPACETVLPDVGLLNRLSKGEISVGELRALLERTHGMELFNAALDESPFQLEDYMHQVDECQHFDREEKVRRKGNIVAAAKYLQEIVLRHLGSAALTPNNLNLALAKEYGGSKTCIAGSDSHNFNWLYTSFSFITRFFWFIKDMGAFGQAHNTLWLAKEQEQKPSAADIVSFIAGSILPASKTKLAGAEWKARVFSEMKDGAVRVTEARGDIAWTQKVFDFAENLYYKIFKQGKVLAGDTFKQAKKQGELHEFPNARGSIPA